MPAAIALKLDPRVDANCGMSLAETGTLPSMASSRPSPDSCGMLPVSDRGRRSCAPRFR